MEELNYKLLKRDLFGLHRQSFFYGKIEFYIADMSKKAMFFCEKQTKYKLATKVMALQKPL